MIYDPLKVAIAAVRATVKDVPVASDLIGHRTGHRRVVITLMSPSVAFNRRLDRIRIDVETYGPTKQDALMLAMRARHALLEEAPGKAFHDVVISDASGDVGPSDISDPVSREHRFFLSLDLYMYLRSKPIGGD